MVKLRSGFVYIDNKLFNTFVEKFNTFINNINFKIINDTNGKLFKKIIKLNKSLKLNTNQFGEKYFKYKNIKMYINFNNKQDKNSNIRKKIYEDIWILMISLIKNLKKNIEKVIKLNINNLNHNKCFICYDNFKLNDTIKICKNNDNNYHYYHNLCFNTLISINNINYTNYYNKNKKYECPYCKCNTVNSNKIYKIV